MKGQIKITRNSNSAKIVQAIIRDKTIPVIIPICLFPFLYGSQKQRNVNPIKIKLDMRLKWFIQITGNVYVYELWRGLITDNSKQ